MKNTVKYILFAFLATFVAGCSPQEFDKYSLGKTDRITSEQVSFTQQVSTQSDNIITFTNTTNVPFPTSFTWDLGNGVVTKDNPAKGMYPNAGTYTVSLAVSSPDGTTVIKSATIVIANDDFSLFDTPLFRALTGGPDNAAGKTWVFDQYNLYTKRVADESGKNIKGHMGLGPQHSYGHDWWGADPNEKSMWQMYDFKFNFSQSGGLALTITTAGTGYGRLASSASIGGFTGITVVNPPDDVAFPYSGGNYSYSLDEDSNYPKLTLSGNAFMGYYCGTQNYDIIYIDDEVMALRVDNAVEGQDWVFVYIREDLNVAEPPIIKTLQAIPLFEDFEGTPSVVFALQDMGSFTNAAYHNPAPVPINQSSRVFLYDKSNAFYSNISFTTKDYLFDLTTLNKIRMKVFIPGYNDYTTVGNVDGPWVANNTLQKKVAVKLQDSTMGGNAWQTQAEVVHTGLATDTWLALEFDFSPWATRIDFDKIVIQFGDEGHSCHGIFFFDDFEFDE